MTSLHLNGNQFNSTQSERVLDVVRTEKLALLSLNGWSFEKATVRQRLAVIIADAPKLKDVWIHCQTSNEKIFIECSTTKKGVTGGKVKI